jgi:predicted nuclease of predicted toxin-antitoxin system
VKVLIDSCVAKAVGAALATAGHEVESVADWPADPGDAVILGEAHRVGRVIVTLDKDFGELAVVRGHTHSGIVRLVGLTTAQQPVVAVAVFGRYGGELARGAIVTADPGRTRVRLIIP